MKELFRAEVPVYSVDHGFYTVSARMLRWHSRLKCFLCHKCFRVGDKVAILDTDRGRKRSHQACVNEKLPNAGVREGKKWCVNG